MFTGQLSHAGTKYPTPMTERKRSLIWLMVSGDPVHVLQLAPRQKHHGGRVRPSEAANFIGAGESTGEKASPQ